MDNHWVHGGRHPRRCWERFRRRSGQQPLRPYRTTGKSCSWPLLVLSLGLRAVRGPLSMLGCPLSSSATGTSVTKPSISAASQTSFSVGKRFPICLMSSNSTSLICLDERREPSPAPLSSFELADRSADPLCDLPSDAPSRRQGAFVHRFSRRAVSVRVRKRASAARTLKTGQIKL